MLKLPPGQGLEANRLLAGTHSELGMDVSPQDRATTGVALLPQLRKNDGGVPDAGSQLMVNKAFVGIELADPGCFGTAVGRGWQRQHPFYGPVAAANLVGDIH